MSAERGTEQWADAWTFQYWPSDERPGDVAFRLDHGGEHRLDGRAGSIDAAREIAEAFANRPRRDHKGSVIA